MTTNSTSATGSTTFRDWLAQHDPVTDETSAVDQLMLLEECKGMLEAEQARVAAEFEALRLAREAREKVPKSQRGKGLAAEIALARRESPARGKRHLELSRALAEDMPHTRRALSAGRIREEHAQSVVNETTMLSSDHRKQVDHAMKDRLGAAGPRELANEAKAHAQRLDPDNTAQRARKVTEDRRVTCESLGDGMSKLTAVGPSQLLQAAYQNLRQAARTQLSTGKTQDAAGNPRSRDQLLFDALIERTTGQSDATVVPVQVLLLMTPNTLFAQGDTPAWLIGHGPIPAAVARAWLADPKVAVELRRLFTDPKGQGIVALESKARAFPAGLRNMVLARDNTCRTPYCEAAIQETDHMTPYRDGGTTSWQNASGLCAACNQTKENRGWKHDGSAQTLNVTTPTGHTYTKIPGPIIPGTGFIPGLRHRNKQPDGDVDDDADPDDANPVRGT